jgi:hypothetical protein
MNQQAKPLTIQEKQQLFNEAFTNHSFISQMNTYQIEVVLKMVNNRLTAKTDRFIDLIQANPDYRYPEGWPEDRLLEYWQQRDPEYNQLQRFKAALVMGLHKDALPAPESNQENDKTGDISRYITQVADRITDNNNSTYSKETIVTWLNAVMDNPD